MLMGWSVRLERRSIGDGDHATVNGVSLKRVTAERTSLEGFSIRLLHMTSKHTDDSDVLSIEHPRIQR